MGRIQLASLSAHGTSKAISQVYVLRDSMSFLRMSKMKKSWLVLNEDFPPHHTSKNEGYISSLFKKLLLIIETYF